MMRTHGRRVSIFGTLPRRRGAVVAGAAAVALVAAACSSSATQSPVTVTETTHVSAPSPSGGPSSSGGANSSGGTPSSTSTPQSTGSSTGSSSTSTSATASTTTTSGNPNAEPDGFVPTKLKPGEKPPQFIAVSFDGAGWHEKWEYYRSIAAKVPFHFTANLTGLYLLDEAHKDYYKGPGHARGSSSLGSWNTPAEVKQEVEDLNTAYADGDEIATHFMGHFCDPGASPGANEWTTAQWDDELDQFFDVVKNFRSVDKVAGMPKLDVPASEIVGERTPCLQSSPEKLFPALAKHGMTYDQSFTHRGVIWPTKSPKYGIWNMGMAEFPLHGITPGHGPNHFQITMDYNFWYSQEIDESTGQMKQVSKAQSKKDSKQVQATYQDMLDGAMASSHAPLLLGNHFNEWNNNAYTEALGNFLLANCGRSGVYCVPYRDVVDWMEMQDPSVLKALQAEPPVVGPPSKG